MWELALMPLDFRTQQVLLLKRLIETYAPLGLSSKLDLSASKVK